MSRNLCCVKDCKNSKYERPDLSFHNFPTKEPQRLRKWIEFCENQSLSQLYETNDQKLDHKSICSEHFEDNKYNNPMKKIRLMCNALPTIRSNEKKPQFVPNIQKHPTVQVIPAQFLLRTNLSRGWRPRHEVVDRSSETIPFVNNETNSESEVKLLSESKPNPIIKQSSERHLRYENEIKNLREKLKKSKKQVMNLRYRLKRLNPIGNTRKSKLNYILRCIKSLGEDVLNPLMSEIIEYHLMTAFLNKSRVQKWTTRMKKFCADLYHKSPNTYCFLQKTITLPTKKTILKFTEEQIQSSRTESSIATTCHKHIELMDTNVSEMIEKFTENQVINFEPIDDLLSNNQMNAISIEFNRNDKTNQEFNETIASNQEFIDSNAIELESIDVDTDKSLTTDGTVVYKYNPEMRTYTRAKE